MEFNISTPQKVCPLLRSFKLKILKLITLLVQNLIFIDQNTWNMKLKMHVVIYSKNKKIKNVI